MATEITVAGSLSFSFSGVTGGVSGPTPSPYKLDFTAPESYLQEPQTMSSSFADVDLGGVGWTDAKIIQFKNLSATVGEDIIILAYPGMAGDFTDDGTVAGASLTATLTSAGYYKFITADGTAQGTDWIVGDLAVYLGSSGVYGRIRPQKFIMEEGQICGPFHFSGTGTAFKARALSGTPLLEKIAVGPCAA